jgi:hypothetical protein
VLNDEERHNFYSPVEYIIINDIEEGGMEDEVNVT